MLLLLGRASSRPKHHCSTVRQPSRCSLHSLIGRAFWASSARAILGAERLDLAWATKSPVWLIQTADCTPAILEEIRTCQATYGVGVQTEGHFMSVIKTEPQVVDVPCTFSGELVDDLQWSDRVSGRHRRSAVGGDIDSYRDQTCMLWRSTVTLESNQIEYIFYLLGS